jgi:hypothetical protein
MAYLALVDRLILDEQLVVLRLDYPLVRKVVWLSCARYFCLHSRFGRCSQLKFVASRAVGVPATGRAAVHAGQHCRDTVYI